MRTDVVAAALGMLALATIAAGCTTGSGGVGTGPPPSFEPATTTEPDVAGPFDPDAQIRPETIELAPTAAAPGSLVAVTFPSGTLRGTPYVLERATDTGWTLEAFLISDREARGDAFPVWYPPDEVPGWDDIGIGGPGPDLLLVPPATRSGRYRVCTANSIENVCAELTVTDDTAVADTAPVDESSLTVHVSNQSFDDPTVRLSIAIGDRVVAVNDHEVGDQHNFDTHHLDIEPGEHRLVVVADTGVGTTETITLPDDGTHRWIYIGHWGTRGLDIQISDEPFTFG